MVCKQSWISKYYENPLKEYGDKIKIEKYIFNDEVNSNNDNGCNECKKFCCRRKADIICTIVICIIVMGVILLFGYLSDGKL